MGDKHSSEGLALTLFERNLKQALRLLDDPERLGQASPLANAYMLSAALHDLPRPVATRDRGAVLGGRDPRCGRAALGQPPARLAGGDA